MWRKLVIMAAIIGTSGLSSAAWAQTVTLTSKDGFTKFEGELIKLEGGFYVVATSVGEVRIPTADVMCEGAGCPNLTIAGPAQQSPLPTPQNDIRTNEQTEQIELFKSFLEWREKNPNYKSYIEQQKKNPE